MPSHAAFTFLLKLDPDILGTNCEKKTRKPIILFPENSA
jgi:hypothetical protein